MLLLGLQCAIMLIIMYNNEESFEAYLRDKWARYAPLWWQDAHIEGHICVQPRHYAASGAHWHRCPNMSSQSADAPILVDPCNDPSQSQQSESI